MLACLALFLAEVFVLVQSGACAERLPLGVICFSSTKLFSCAAWLVAILCGVVVRCRAYCSYFLMALSVLVARAAVFFISPAAEFRFVFDLSLRACASGCKAVSNQLPCMRPLPRIQDI